MEPIADWISARFSPPRRARSSSTSASSPRPSRCSDTARANNCDVAGGVATLDSAAPFAQRFWLLMLYSYSASIGIPAGNLRADPAEKVLVFHHMDRSEMGNFPFLRKKPNAT